jgi:hypothetical protein
MVKEIVGAMGKAWGKYHGSRSLALGPRARCCLRVAVGITHRHGGDKEQRHFNKAIGSHGPPPSKKIFSDLEIIQYRGQNINKQKDSPATKSLC